VKLTFLGAAGTATGSKYLLEAKAQSHGRGTFVRALLGSTSEGVLRKTDVPVLIVPARAVVAD
jgi:nucleotide-binding universal stress UspA family protein